MIKVDDTALLPAALPQRQLADHASRQWQTALEREWLQAWPTSLPTVPDTVNEVSSRPPAASSAFLSGVTELPAETQPAPGTASALPLVPAPVAASASNKPARNHPAATANPSPSFPASISSGPNQNVSSSAEPAAKTNAAWMNALSQSALAAVNRTVEPAFNIARPSGFVFAFGNPPLQPKPAEPAQPQTSVRTAGAGLTNLTQWDSALRLASPESGKVQASLRDASLNPEGAHRVAMNLSGTLSSMGFDAIRIYVNGKHYAVGKDGLNTTRPARTHTATMPTTPPASNLKE
jgi:hypothetical protein